ncbi:MAG: GntR family transcriptional regulator [Flavobacteriaceae bacterium]|nr:GntR family transcriptional regulator [Flavobacteriaceae bacterium]
MSSTLVENIIQAIRDEIRNGYLVAGQRLVVAELSKKYDVSFGPVREAIRRLAGEGYLEFVPHKGASVKGFGEKEVREYFALREALEGYVAKLAAENIHRSDYREQMLAMQKVLNEQMLSSVIETSIEVRQQFHDVMYVIAGNDLVKEAAQRYTFPLQRSAFSRQAGKERIKASLHEHNEIIDAILAGNGVQAERLMRSHLRNRAQAYLEMMDELQQSGDNVA